MSLDPKEACQFLTRRTLDVKERVAVLFVKEKRFRDNTEADEGMQLREFMPGVPKADALERGYGDYRLTGTTEAPAGYLGFTFAKPKTLPVNGGAQPFRTRVKRMKKEWPHWMRMLYAIEDPTVPYEIVTAGGSTFRGRVFDRMEIIPGGYYETEVTIEEFLSPVPTEAEWLDSISPVTTLVQWNFMGCSGSLECLHPFVKIPEQHTGGRMVPDFGTANARERHPGFDLFPATNLPGWMPYTAKNDEDLVDGVYYRVRETYTPIYIPPATYI
jgi:hypothetical protein